MPGMLLLFQCWKDRGSGPPSSRCVVQTVKHYLCSKSLHSRVRQLRPATSSMLQEAAQ